jgi:Bacterial SH3 domain
MRHMDYVKRRLEQARQKAYEEKTEEAVKQYKLSQETTQATKNANSKFENHHSRLNITSMLIGFAAGVAVITTVSVVYLSAFDNNQASQNIDLLNRKLELLDENITGLENKLKGVLALADSSKNRENKRVITGNQKISELTNSTAAPDATESGVALLALETPKRAEIFTPTHTVTTNVNLRSSASLDSPPIGVLAKGTKIQKISENDDWYYVNTEEFGKGWCFARYLSP